MNNLIYKNYKAVLKSTETVLFDYNINYPQNIICLGGYICNTSTNNNYLGTDDYVFLKIYNTVSNETTFILDNILISPRRCLPFSKIFLKPNDRLIGYSTEQNILHICIFQIEEYQYNYGLIKVNFSPEAVISFNPTWMLSTDLQTKYRNNEYVPLISGNYTIVFKDIEGWEEPSNLTVNVKNSKTTEINAKYDLLDSTISFSNKQVELPGEFTWKIVGQKTTYLNNEVITLPPGKYTFEFQRMVGYESLPNMILDLAAKQNKSYEIIYHLIKYPVTVNLNPPSLRISKSTTIYNKWRICFPNNGYSSWYNSGETIKLKAGQNYQIEIQKNDYFEDVENIYFNLEIENDLKFNVDLKRK